MIDFGSILVPKLAGKSTPKLINNRSKRGWGLWPNAFSCFLQNPRNRALAQTRARFSRFQVCPKNILIVSFGPLACTRAQFSPCSLFHALLNKLAKSTFRVHERSIFAFSGKPQNCTCCEFWPSGLHGSSIGRFGTGTGRSGGPNDTGIAVVPTITLEKASTGQLFRILGFRCEVISGSDWIA